MNGPDFSEFYQATTPTLPSFRDRAIAAAQERREQEQRNRDEGERRRIDELTGFLSEGIGFLANGQGFAYLWELAVDSRDQQRYPIATMGGDQDDDEVRLTVRPGGGYQYELYLVLPCPTCGQDALYLVRSMADVGVLLEPDASRDLCWSCDG